MTFKPGDLVKYRALDMIQADNMSPLFLVLDKKISRFSGMELRILNIRNNASGWYRATEFRKVEK